MRPQNSEGEVTRLAVLAALLLLVLFAAGCQPILKDLLAGEECGDHGIWAPKAAAAGIGASLAALAGVYLQRMEDGIRSLWPWGESGTSVAPSDEELSAGKDAESSKLLKKDEEAPWDRDSAQTPAETSPESKEKTPSEGGEEEKEPEKGPAEEEEKAPPDKKEEPDKKGKTEDKKKPTSPVEKYVPLTTVGDVTVLINPETGKVAVGDGRYIGGKDENGYWITKDGKVVVYNKETGNATVSDGHFSAEKDGTTYTVTQDNKVLSYDQKGNLKVSDGHFTASREGTSYTVTKDNKVIEYDHMTGGFKVSDGHYTATHEGTVYAVTNDNKVLSYDQASGNIKVSDGHFTATRENTVYSVTKDNKILTYNQGSGEFKVSDGHYVLEREGSTTAFTNDNVVIEYNRDTRTVAVSTKGSRGELTVGAGRDGQYLFNAGVKGSMNGTPTTFGVTAAKYNVPETGGQGFAGGLSLEQKDFGVSAQFLKEEGEKSLAINVRKDDWSVGYLRRETFGTQGVSDSKTYNLGYRDVKLGFEEGGGRTLTTAGYTRRWF